MGKAPDSGGIPLFAGFRESPGSDTFDLPDRRELSSEVSEDDLMQQFVLSLQARDKLTETHQGILRIREVRKQVDEMSARLDALAISRANGARITCS